MTIASSSAESGHASNGAVMAGFEVKNAWRDAENPRRDRCKMLRRGTERHFEDGSTGRMFERGGRGRRDIGTLERVRPRDTEFGVHSARQE